MSDYQPTPPPSYPYAPQPPLAPSPVLSILALVFGIIGVVGSFIYGIGFLPAVAGVVLGFVGRRKDPVTAKGLWLTGIITGFVGVGIALLWVAGIIVIALLVAAHGAGSSTSFGSLEG